jgi:hypothetical protein
MQMSPSEGLMIRAVELQSELTVCRLELDINTAEDFVGELPHEPLPDLFQELTKLGLEIATQGDIP